MPIFGILEGILVIEMELVAIIGLVLFLTSEILPFTPLKGNGIAQAILEAGMKAFPRPEKPE